MMRGQATRLGMALLIVLGTLASSPLTWAATDVPQVTFNGGALDWPPLPLGSAATRGLTLTNTGTAPLHIARTQLRAPTQRRARAEGFTFTSNTCVAGAVLDPGASCSLTIQFKPAALGTVTATLVVSDDAPDGPQIVGLTGMGVPPGAPVITSVSPAFGYTNAETHVTITGFNLVDATNITVGGQAATTICHLTNLTDGAATCTTLVPPALDGEGPVDIAFTNPNGTNDLTPADQFHYIMHF